MYLRNASGVLIFFDVTKYDALPSPALCTFPDVNYMHRPRRETFEHVPDWVAEARSRASEQVSIVLVGCKKDLVAQRAVTRDEASKYAEASGAPDCLLSLAYTRPRHWIRRSEC